MNIDKKNTKASWDRLWTQETRSFRLEDARRRKEKKINNGGNKGTLKPLGLGKNNTFT